jgi:hypothetical protein
MLKKIAAAGTIALMVLLLSPFPAFALGIGIAPSQILVNNALRGGEYERTVTVFNPDENANNFTLRTEGEAGGWISFYKFENVNTPIKEISIGAQGNYPVLAKINISPDAAKGTYNATVIAETIPVSTNETGTVAAVLQASVSVTVEVTGDQVIGGVVNAIIVEDTEPGYPVRVKIVFENTGNVVAKPKIDITIHQDNNIITSFTHERTKVKPTSNEPIIAEWNTTAKNVPGDYKAKMVVSLDGRTLRSEDVPFKIMPVGTFTRLGNLTAIHIEGEPAVDTMAKVKAVFQNTGQIETSAKFSGEAYKDNKLIDTLTSDELMVQKNKEVVLTSYLKLTSPGDYIVKGKVIYSGKETAVKEFSFKVGKATPGFEAIYAVAVVLVLLMIRKKVKI